MIDLQFSWSDKTKKLLGKGFDAPFRNRVTTLRAILRERKRLLLRCSAMIFAIGNPLGFVKIKSVISAFGSRTITTEVVADML